MIKLFVVLKLILEEQFGEVSSVFFPLMTCLIVDDSSSECLADLD